MILPARLREELLWRSTNPNMNYDAFRLHVTTQASDILRDRRRGDGGHAADRHREEPEAKPEAEPDATAFFDEGTRAGMRRAMAQRFRRAGLRAASTSWRRAGAAAISATRLTRCCCPRRIR